MSFLSRMFLFLVIFFNQLFSNDTPLKIAIINDMVPFSFIDENNKPNGILVDYWKLWSKKTNINVEFVSSSWQNSLNNIKEKRVDIHSGLFINEERKKYIDFVNPIYKSKVNIYINKKHTNSIKTIEDLNHKTMGLIKDTFFESYLEQKYPNIRIKQYDSYKDLLNAISENKVDSFIEDSIIAWVQLIKYFKFNDVKLLTTTKINKSFYTGVVKDNIRLKKLVEEGASQITKSDLITLENRWISNDQYKFYKNENILTPKEKTWLQKNPIVKLAVIKNWNLFSFIDKDGKLKGFHLDLLKQINKNLNIKLDYELFDSWEEAYNAAQNKEVDGIFGLSWIKEREKYFNYSPVYQYSPFYIVVHKDNNSIQEMSDFNNKEVFSEKNHIINKIILKEAPSSKFIYKKGIPEILDALSKNKTAVTIIDNAKKHDLDKYNLKTVKYLVSKAGQLSIGINNSKPMLSSIITKAINTVSTEQLDFIRNKWLRKKVMKSIFSQEELTYIQNSKVLKVGIEYLDFL